jgi:hypothetical protein
VDERTIEGEFTQKIVSLLGVVIEMGLEVLMLATFILFKLGRVGLVFRRRMEVPFGTENEARSVRFSIERASTAVAPEFTWISKTSVSAVNTVTVAEAISFPERPMVGFAPENEYPEGANKVKEVFPTGKSLLLLSERVMADTIPSLFGAQTVNCPAFRTMLENASRPKRRKKKNMSRFSIACLLNMGFYKSNENMSSLTLRVPSASSFKKMNQCNFQWHLVKVGTHLTNKKGEVFGLPSSIKATLLIA